MVEHHFNKKYKCDMSFAKSNMKQTTWHVFSTKYCVILKQRHGITQGLFHGGARQDGRATAGWG